MGEIRSREGENGYQVPSRVEREEWSDDDDDGQAITSIDGTCYLNEPFFTRLGDLFSDELLDQLPS